MDAIIFHFGLFFALFTPLTAQKINILKKWKKYLETSSLYKWVPKLWSDDIWFLRYDAWRMDGQTDRQKKWLKEVGAPPNNHFKHKNKKVTPSWLKLKPKPSPCPFFFNLLKNKSFHNSADWSGLYLQVYILLWLAKILRFVVFRSYTGKLPHPWHDLIINTPN